MGRGRGGVSEPEPSLIFYGGGGGEGAAAAAAKSLQSCPTLCDPIYSSPPGSSIHGILQAREYWSGLPLVTEQGQ